MFHWICPECGREIAPTVRECPVCDPAEDHSEPVHAGDVEAPARTLNSPAVPAATRGQVTDVPLVSEAPALGSNGHGTIRHTSASLLNRGLDRGYDTWSAQESSDVAPPPAQIAPVEVAVGESGDAAQAEPPALQVESPSEEPPSTNASQPRLPWAELRAIRFGKTVRSLRALSAIEQPKRNGSAGLTKPAPLAPAAQALSLPEVPQARPADPPRLAPLPSPAAAIAGEPMQAILPAPSVRAVEAAPELSTPEPILPSLAPDPGQNSLNALMAALGMLDIEIAEEAAHPAQEDAEHVQESGDRVPAGEPEDGAHSSKTDSAAQPTTQTEAPEADHGPEAALAQAEPPAELSAHDATKAPRESAADLESQSPAAETPKTEMQDSAGQRSPKDEVWPEEAERVELQSEVTRLEAAAEVALTEVATAEVAPAEVQPENAAESESPSTSSAADENADAIAQPESLKTEPVEPDPPQSGKIPLSIRPIPPALNALVLALRPAIEPPPSKPVLVETEAGAKETFLPGIQSPVPLPELQPTALGRADANAAVADLQDLASAIGQAKQPESAKPFPAPSMAALLPYSPLAGRPLRPAVPQQIIFKSDCAPRITLPGPMLPARLLAFQERDLTAAFPEARKFRKNRVPAWLVMVLILGTVVAGFTSFFSIVPRSGAEVKAEAAAVPVNTVSANPLARTIEVTGIRVLVDPSRKSQIQYLVVNHSGARFADATVYVTLRGADAKPGQAPLCKFAFSAPDLGPYESREMISEIEKLNRPVTVPEWQDLRAEIELGQ